MGGCLSCSGGDPRLDVPFESALQPKSVPESVRISADASARWPSTDVGSLHCATFSSDSQTNAALGSAFAAETTGTESSIEVLTPSPTCTKTPGDNPFTASSRTELVRTPAGPLEGSPSSASEASAGEEAAARNKCITALFDKVAGSKEPPGDFDIPAVRTMPHTPHQNSGHLQPSKDTDNN